MVVSKAARELTAKALAGKWDSECQMAHGELKASLGKRGCKICGRAYAKEKYWEEIAARRAQSAPEGVSGE